MAHAHAAVYYVTHLAGMILLLSLTYKNLFYFILLYCHSPIKTLTSFFILGHLELTLLEGLDSYKTKLRLASSRLVPLREGGGIAARGLKKLGRRRPG